MVTRRGLKKEKKEQVEQLISGVANISMNNEEEAGKMLALSAIYSREEELMKMKMEVREKVQAHLRRVEEDAKRLAVICKVSSIMSRLFLCLVFVFSRRLHEMNIVV